MNGASSLWYDDTETKIIIIIIISLTLPLFVASFARSHRCAAAVPFLCVCVCLCVRATACVLVAEQKAFSYQIENNIFAMDFGSHAPIRAHITSVRGNIRIVSGATASDGNRWVCACVRVFVKIFIYTYTRCGIGSAQWNIQTSFLLAHFRPAYLVDSLPHSAQRERAKREMNCEWIYIAWAWYMCITVISSMYTPKAFWFYCHSLLGCFVCFGRRRWIIWARTTYGCRPIFRFYYAIFSPIFRWTTFFYCRYSESVWIRYYIS